jgi:hypothetical protein
MSSDRPFPLGWTAGILLLLSLVFAGWAHRQRRQLQAEMAELTKEQSLLDSSIKRTQAGIDRETRAAADRKAAAQAKVAAALAGSRPDVDAILSAHPDLLAAFVKATRGYLNQTYGSVYARLHLSPDEVDRLQTLVVNDLENRMDLMAAARSQGLAEGSPEIVSERARQVADLQTAEQGLLGQPAYDAYSAVARAEAIRGTVEQLAYMTTFSANPLTGDQAEQLVQLTAQSSSDYTSGKDASSATIDWDAVIAKAPGFLTSSQVNTLQGVAQSSRFQNLAKQYSAQQTPAN